MAEPLNRRAFIGRGAAAVAAGLAGPAVTACLGPAPELSTRASPRLTARPLAPTVTATPGLTRLGLASGRDGLLYVPQGYSSDTAWPLVVGLHGAGGSSDDWSSYLTRAEQRGMVFMAPDSRYGSWNVAGYAWGADADFVDAALAHTFQRCRIDPARVALAGFSDGASCALWLGLINGDLFTHVIAYSPGLLILGASAVGKPPIFISHGSLDQVFPVTVTRDQIVPQLRDAGYDVTYLEFAGDHAVPAAVSEAALDWFFGAAPPPGGDRRRAIADARGGATR